MPSQSACNAASSTSTPTESRIPKPCLIPLRAIQVSPSIRQENSPATPFFHIRRGLARLRPLASAGTDEHASALCRAHASPANHEFDVQPPISNRACRGDTSPIWLVDAARRNGHRRSRGLDTLHVAGKPPDRHLAGHLGRHDGDDRPRSLVD